MNKHTAQQPILYFDGVCNLCNRSIQFVIRHDKKKQFRFAPLQSAAGKAAQQAAGDAENGTGSVVLYYNGQYYTRSAAALYTLKLLGGIRSLAFAFMIVPAFIRNGVYNFIARNRYKWFGSTDNCMVPTPELQSRFIG